MDFASIRVITSDAPRLVAFYEEVTAAAATWYSPDFAELVLPSCTLAVASERTLALHGEGVARPAANDSVIVEFRVADTDAEHERLAALGRTVVQEPTTMPWGNRSLLLRDPDGNLVNLFTPVTEAARQRLDR
ncbi:VOC family protein [Streptomyces sp. NPDC047002]|uniref:VOC family protein n=1 Tax=Streptomyces sp. NPDC047002 TaxID=3155475 RepID=UPI003453C283